MTNKTQNQMIGTALPSDSSERDTDSMIDHIHRRGFVHTGPPVCVGGRVCEHCGAKICARHVEPVRTLEFVLNCLSGIFLIAVVVCVGYLLNSLAEHGFANFFDHWVWQEPLSDWYL